MAELTMPRLSDTMQEGTLARWLKKPGQTIEKGDVVAEIETDKATMELEAYESGVLREILVQEGETVPIGQPIAVIGEAGEGGEAGGRRAAAGGRGRGDAETRRRGEAGKKTAVAPSPAEEERIRVRGEPLEAPAAGRRPPAAEEIKASPMARAIARERGLDLATIQGTGPGDRIIRADVETALAGAAPPAGRRPPAAEPPPEDVEEVPLNNMRRVIARRMLESVQTTPHVFLISVVDVEPLLSFQTELNERLAQASEQTKLSLNDLLIKACAITLRASPEVNVSFAGDKLLRHKRVNIGLAVAVEGGLLVPVVRDADQKSLGQISDETKDLVVRARAGELTPDDYSGGTFTISNLGMFGIDHFTAIINPPQAAVLAVGAITPEAVVRAGQIVVRQTLKLTLSMDHRALDGATAARFLQQLKTLLERPLRMVV